MPPIRRQELGAQGEAAATARYEALGYEVLERNWRCRAGEIDLIVADDSTVVFVEVKTRSSDRYGSGAEAVGWDKQRRIRTVALEWLDAQACTFQGVRFDVAVVTTGPGTWRVQLIESAF